MYSKNCQCASCRHTAAGGFEVMEFSGETSAPFSEQEETELAMELLSVSSEAELEQFLGNVFKKAWQGIKKVAKPLGGALKGIAKAALPMVGGALGSFIPIPGVGTALGSALEVELNELGEMAQEDRELETARRVVRIAGTAAKLAGDSDGSPQAVRSALLQAVRTHAPHMATRTERCAAGSDGEGYCGPWRKRRAERFPLLELM
jgi:hypothetical protein